MPELRCTVQSCMHNQDQYCSLNSITVGGDQAKSPQETKCVSFEERKTGTYSNMGSKEASPECKIKCEAKDCHYNEACQCQAGKISVEGSGACRCDETECATFTCR